MQNIFPDLFVREAFVSLFSDVGAPCYDMVVPKDIEIPNQYILLTDQENRQHSTNKCGHLWATTILLDVVSQNLAGYSNRQPLDELCSNINSLIDLDNGDITIANFQVMNTQVLNSRDMTLQTPTKTINRKLIRYQFILAKTSVPGSGSLPYTLDFILS